KQQGVEHLRRGCFVSAPEKSRARLFTRRDARGKKARSSERPALRLRPEPVDKDEVHRTRSGVDRHTGSRNLSAIESIPVWNQCQVLIPCPQLKKEREV